MRTVYHSEFESINPAYLKIGEETHLVSFPGENNNDPGWDHTMLLKRLSENVFQMEECRMKDFREGN